MVHSSTAIASCEAKRKKQEYEYANDGDGYKLELEPIINVLKWIGDPKIVDLGLSF